MSRKTGAPLRPLYVVEPPFLPFHVFVVFGEEAVAVCAHRATRVWEGDLKPGEWDVPDGWPRLVPVSEIGGLEGWRTRYITHCHSCERVLRARGYEL